MATAIYRSPSQRILRGLLWAISLLVLFYLIAPLLAIMPLSFSSSQYLFYPIPQFSLRWYDEFFSSEQWLLAMRNSLIIGAATTLLATTLGTLASLGLSQNRFPLKSVVIGFVMAPMILPVIIIAISIYFFFAPLGLTDSFLGLILAHTTLAVPLVVITVSATLAGFDRDLARAAASLGANPIHVFFKVTLPIVLPGIVSGAIFAFTTSFDELVTTLFLASSEQNTLPRQMFMGIRYFLSPTITAVATLLITFSILILIAIAILSRRGERLRGQQTISIAKNA